MSNLGDILSGNGVTLVIKDLPKLLRLLQIAKEADEIIGEIRADLKGGDGKAE